MIHYLKKNRWSPYIAGIFIALISLGSFYFFGHMLGTSTAFIRFAAAIISLFAPQYVATNSYYSHYLAYNYWIDWQVALVFGIFIGAFIAARLYKKITINDVPTIWKNRFGANHFKRYLGAFLGGIIILFGARRAGGCTSGHAITGGMQLAVSGWIFMITLFAIGIPTAYILYATKGK